MTDRPAGDAVLGFELELLGLRVLVCGDHREFLAELGACFEQAPSQRTASGFSTHDLRLAVSEKGPRDGSPPASITTEPAGAFEDNLSGVLLTPQAVAGAISSWAVICTTTHYTFHGGAVARDGKGILLPAGSYQGKSSLTAALVQHGFHLLSDEVAAIEAGLGRMVPYPRVVFLRADVLSSLGIGPSCGRVLEEGAVRALTAGDLGGVRASGDIRPALIVQPTFAAGREVAILPLDPPRAFALLQRTSCNAAGWGEAGFNALVALARDTPSYRLIYGKTEDAVKAIVDLLPAARN